MLEYMASNYLVANPAKTEYMVVNRVARDTSLDHITVEGYTVKAKKSVKVLGLQMTETLAWEGHFKELIKAIKQRLSIFYRTAARLPKACLGPIIHGIVVSKIRYGIVLYGGVRICDGDPVNKRNQQLQTIINNLARFVSGKRLKDRVPTEKLLKDTRLPSINQICAEETLMITFKAMKTFIPGISENLAHARKTSVRTRHQEEDYLQIPNPKKHRGEFVQDAVRLWNKLPRETRQETNERLFRKAVKSFSRGLPV